MSPRTRWAARARHLLDTSTGPARQVTDRAWVVMAMSSRVPRTARCVGRWCCHALIIGGWPHAAAASVRTLATAGA